MKLPNLEKDRSLSDAVYRAVYVKITSGKLIPGERITEDAIAKAMGISRAPVREALKRLREDGLIVLAPRSGCFVAEFTPEEIEEIYEIRNRLECMAMERAFEALDSGRVLRLRNDFKACLKLSSEEMVKRELSLDAQFHKMIVQASGYRTVLDLLRKLRARIQVFRVREAVYPDRAAAALKEHVGILDAVLAGDKTQAVSRLMAHITRTKHNVLQTGRNTYGSGS